jgi:hypothetical protein
VNYFTNIRYYSQKATKPFMKYFYMKGLVQIKKLLVKPVDTANLEILNV